MLSVIIPSYNKEKRLRLVLQTLVRQSCEPKEFEVIVIDDGSTDQTREMVMSFTDNHNFNIKYVYQSNKGRAAARNTGIKNARGDILLFLDDDRVVKEDFIREHLRIFEEAGDTGLVVLGNRLCLFISGFEAHYEEIQRWIQESPEEIYKRGRDEFYYWHTVKGVVNIPSICWITFVTGNVSLGAKIFEKVGLFNEGFQGWGFEDTELGYRLWLAGVPYIYNEAAVNYHFEHLRSRQEVKEDYLRNLEFCLKIHPDPIMQYYYRHKMEEISLDEFHQLCVTWLKNGRLRSEMSLGVKNE